MHMARLLFKIYNDIAYYYSFISSSQRVLFFSSIISYFVGNSSTNFMTFLPIVVISSQIGLRVMVLWFTCAFRSNRSNQIQALIPGMMLCMCAGNSSSRQHEKKAQQSLIRSLWDVLDQCLERWCTVHLNQVLTSIHSSHVKAHNV